jgi:hypothetical protein
MGGAYSMHGRNGKYYNILTGIPEGKRPLKGMGVDGNTTLK